VCQFGLRDPSSREQKGARDFFFSPLCCAMVRGVAKAQSQAKAQKKADALQSKGSQLEDQKKGLKLMCPTCKVSSIRHKSVRHLLPSKRVQGF